MSHACGELCGLYFIGNQIDKKGGATRVGNTSFSAMQR